MREEHYQFDARLADHHWWWAARRTILRAAFRKHIAPSAPRTILEVGCSTGSNLHMLSEFGTVSALELNPTAAEICRELHPDVTLFEQPIPAPLPRRFDVICAFDVIEHIEDEYQTVAWLDQTLNEGGFVFVTVPAFKFLWSQHDEDAHHFRRYTKSHLQLSLEDKFQVLYMTYFNTHLFPVIALARLLQNSGLVNFGGRDKEIGGTGFVNSLLHGIFVAERAWIPSGKLPFGVSLMAIARKAPKV